MIKNTLNICQVSLHENIPLIIENYQKFKKLYGSLKIHIICPKHQLNEFKKKGYVNREYGFVVHRTMADPKWLDPSIDPNGRKPNWCFLGEQK